MSDAPGVKEEDGPHEGPIKTPKQLIVAVLLSFIVPVVVILMLATYVESANRPAAGSDNLTGKALADRTAPVGQAQVQPEAPAASADAAASAAVASAAPAASEAASTPGGADPAAIAAAIAQVAAAKAGGASAPAAGDGGGGVVTVAAAGAAPALYNNVCQACHSAGVAGAPKFGDKSAWAPRVGQGIDGLTASAIHGKGAMPPRGGSQASDGEIKEVVTYMVGAVK